MDFFWNADACIYEKWLCQVYGNALSTAYLYRQADNKIPLWSLIHIWM